MMDPDYSLHCEDCGDELSDEEIETDEEGFAVGPLFCARCRERMRKEWEQEERRRLRKPEQITVMSRVEDLEIEVVSLHIQVKQLKMMEQAFEVAIERLERQVYRLERQLEQHTE